MVVVVVVVVVVVEEDGEGQSSLMVTGLEVPWHPSLGSLPTPS